MKNTKFINFGRTFFCFTISTDKAVFRSQRAILTTERQDLNFEAIAVLVCQTQSKEFFNFEKKVREVSVKMEQN